MNIHTLLQAILYTLLIYIASLSLYAISRIYQSNKKLGTILYAISFILLTTFFYRISAT